MATVTASSSRPAFLGSQRFEIVREIGRGGAGVVFEAFDRERNGRVALKVLRALDAEARLRFKAEFRSLQDLLHPNLVSLGELLEEDGQLFFTMELVRGVDFVVYVREHEVGDVEPSSALAAPNPQDGSPHPPRARRRPRFDEQRLRAALAQLLQGLCALHDARKVHRDIKPSNVLVTAEGRVVILDFGLLADVSAPRRDQHAAGTAHFIAPEQADGRPVGPAADLYSVGVVLYLALTGEYPFRGSPAMALRLKRWVSPPPPGELVSGLPHDLEQICVELLRIDPAARPSGRDVLRRLHVTPAEEERPAMTIRHAFVGRDAELAAMDAALAEARAGRASVQLIEGESGVGKTALLRRFLERLSGDALVLAGRCHERESVPYKALDGVIDALSLHLAGLPHAEVLALLPPDAGLIAEVFPVLRKVQAIAAAPPAAAAIDPTERRALALAALRALFGALARRSPVVIAIDDLQWADEDSLALLAEILRPEEGRRLLLTGALRAGAGISAEHIGRRLGLPAGAIRRLPLGPLPPDDAEALCALLLRGAALGRPTRVRALAEESGGHPLFIDALVRYRLAHERDDSGPARLDDVLGARVARLEPRARELLELAAAAGAPLYLDVAAHAAHAALGELTLLVAQLRGASLARVGGAGRDELIEPFHSRIRDAVLARLDPDKERALHGRLAQAMEAIGRRDPTALAAHWRAAGDPARAARYALEAGVQAEAALAFERAAQLYRMAVALLPAGVEDRRAALLRLGSALSSAGQGVKAAEAFMAATEGAPAAEALELGRRAAQSLLRAGYVEAGLAALRSVLAAAELPMPRTPESAAAELRALRHEARERGLRPSPREGGEVPAEDLARIDVCWSAALGLALVDPLRGAYFQEKGLLLALDAGDSYRAARALAMEAAYLAGEIAPGAPGAPKAAASAELLDAAGALADEIGSTHARGLVRLAEGAASTYVGRWARARQALEEAERIFREQCTGVGWERGAAEAFVVWSLWYLGDARELARRVPVYLREAQERGDRYLEAGLRSAHGNAVWLLRGDPESALREAQAAIQGWSRAGYHLQIYFDLLARAHIGLYRGEGPATHRLFAERWPGLVASGSLHSQAVRVAMTHLRACAALAAAPSAPDPAPLLDEVTRAAAALEAEEASWSDALAASLAASLAAARGDEAAARLHAEAARGFAGADMSLYAAASRRRAGELAGGAEGSEVIAGVDRWMTEQGVADPARLTAMLIPASSR